MDDSIPSGENKLPLILSGVAIAAAALALLFAAKARSEVKTTGEKLTATSEKVEQVSTDVAGVRSSAAKQSDVADLRADLGKLRDDTSANFSQVSANFKQQSEINKTLAGRGHATTDPAKTGPGKTEVVAGPGEYVVKSGDTGTKIAKANGVSVPALTAVNPGVNFNKLHVGQKIKLPAAKATATAPKTN